MFSRVHSIISSAKEPASEPEKEESCTRCRGMESEEETVDNASNLSQIPFSPFCLSLNSSLMGLPFARRPAYSLGKTDLGSSSRHVSLSLPRPFLSRPWRSVQMRSRKETPFPSLCHPPKAFEDMLNPDWKANIGHFEGKTCLRSG